MHKHRAQAGGHPANEGGQLPAIASQSGGRDKNCNPQTLNCQEAALCSMETSCSRLGKGGVTCRKEGSGAEGRESTPERLGELRRLGFFIKKDSYKDADGCRARAICVASGFFH